MAIRRWSMAVLTAMILTASMPADDKTDDPVAKALSKIAQLGPGVHKIKKDDKGRIVSCVLVGQSRISTVLGKAKGLETARTRARLAAVAEFRKWLKENVRVCERAEDQTITLLEGKEEAGKDEVKEAGKAVEKTTKRYESIAEGLVRGVQVLHVEQDGENKVYTLVLGWDAETSNATKKVDKDLKDGGKDAPGKKVDKTIDSKKTTSEDAKKFID